MEPEAKGRAQGVLQELYVITMYMPESTEKTSCIHEKPVMRKKNVKLEWKMRKPEEKGQKWSTLRFALISRCLIF